MILQRFLRAASAGVLAAFALVSSEWLFFVTKPSALDRLPFTDQMVALCMGSLPLMLVAATLGTAAAAGGLVRSSGHPVAPRLLTAVVPGVLLTTTIFLLVENFTYTLFRFNVLTLQGWERHLYAVPLLIGGAAITRRQDRWLNGAARARGGSWATAGATLVLCVAVTVVAWNAELRDNAADTRASPGTRDRPNILIIGADGVSARTMSAYGYPRDTTPYISRWMAEALTFENAFTNSGATPGALGALLSGKLPTTTRVICRPDIFRGRDAWDHLPGVLRRLGYTAGQFGVRYYADAFDVNMREAFDVTILGRKDPAGTWTGWLLTPAWVNSAAFGFLTESIDRIESRVVHVFGLRARKNPSVLVTGRRIADRKRLKQLLEFLTETKQPFFAHAHFMTTHGKMFKPRRALFSSGQMQSSPWMSDFYDDALRDFDSDFEAVMRQLRMSGRYEHTLIVMYADHGFRHSVTERVPLMIRFPGGAFSGRESTNVQLIDVAPTILDHLDVDIPSWMEGTSLVGPPLDPLRPMFAVTSGPYDPLVGSLGEIVLTVCHRQYALDVHTGKMALAVAPGHTAPCPEDALPTEAEAREALIAHLEGKGYPVSATPGGRPSRHGG